MQQSAAFAGERVFYGFMTLVLFAVTLAGFSIDAGLVFHLDSLSGLVLLHGVLMFGWLLTFGAQVTLIAVGQADLHRMLGVAGVGVAAALVVVGVATLVTAARLGGEHLPPHVTPAELLAAGFELLFVFSMLVTAGIALRRRRDVHKRLMLLATIPLLDAAIVRFISAYTTWTIDAEYVRDGVIALCVLVDTIRYRRLHPAFLAGAAFILVCDQLYPRIATAPAWLSFVAWITAS